MSDEMIKRQQGARLAAARKEAGFSSANAAAEQFGWPRSTYGSHERGTRTIGQDDAARYAKAFRSLGVNVTAKSVLFGADADTLAEEPNAPPVKTDESAFLPALLDAVEGSYHMLGLDQEEAAALLQLVLEVAQEQPTPSAGQDFHRVQSEREVRKFLQSKRLQHDGA